MSITLNSSNNSYFIQTFKDVIQTLRNKKESGNPILDKITKASLHIFFPDGQAQYKLSFYGLSPDYGEPSLILKMDKIVDLKSKKKAEISLESFIRNNIIEFNEQRIQQI